MKIFDRVYNRIDLPLVAHLVRLSVVLGFCGLSPFTLAGPRDHFDSKQATATGIVLLDAAGRPIPDAPPQTSGQTSNVSVGPGGSLTFSPSTLSIFVGDTVKWTWASSHHSVTSGVTCTVADSQFCSPSDTNCSSGALLNANAVYSHTFPQAGTYSYFCAAHCNSGMRGTVNVVVPIATITSVASSGSGFTINGLTNPNATVTIESTDDLTTPFLPATTVTANSSGVFQSTDSGSPGLSRRYYRVDYP